MRCCNAFAVYLHISQKTFSLTPILFPSQLLILEEKIEEGKGEKEETPQTEPNRKQPDRTNQRHRLMTRLNQNTPSSQDMLDST